MAKQRTPKGFGGKPKQRSPKRASDSGHSKSHANLIALLGEGEIEGVLGGEQGIYFDGTPVENGDGSKNFGDFSWEFRPGTSFQSHLSAFGDYVSAETSVSSEVKHQLPITRTITNPNLDAIEVRLGFVLQKQKDNGDLVGNSVEYRIEIKQGNGAFENRWQQTLSGVYTSLIEFPFRFPVDNVSGTVSQFTVRVTRITSTATDEDNDVKLVQFQAYAELSYVKLSYKHSAMVGLRFDAAIFDAIPQITFKAALRKVKIPSNAQIAADRGLVYTGVWDGNFIQPVSATSDPLWCLYDLLIDPIYGLGKYLGIAPPNKWLFYELSQYSNEFIPDGRSGLERRFSCNVVLQDRSDALSVIRTWLSIFRGIAYYNGTTIAIAADRPAPPVMQFTQADVVDGIFDYSRSGLKTRNSVAAVTWNDPEQQYERKTTFVEDPTALEIYGYRILEMAAFGCTSEGQARRAGLAALLTDRIESETCTFEARAYAAVCRPGDIVQISDYKIVTASVGGLLKTGSTASQLLLDRPHSFDDSEVQQITITLAGGTTQTRDVNEVASSATIIVPTSPFSEVPSTGANWVLSTFDVQPQLFRVLGVEPKADTNYSIFKITAIEHRPDKQAAIELDAQLQPRSTVRIGGDRALPPTSANLTAFAPPKRLTLTWNEPQRDGARDPFAAAYVVEIKEGDNGWQQIALARTNRLEWTKDLVVDSPYQARVSTLDIIGKQSDWAYSGIAIISKPPAPINLRISDREYRFLNGEAALAETFAFSDPVDYLFIESFEVQRSNIPNQFIASNPRFSNYETFDRAFKFPPQATPYYNYYRVRTKNREGDFSAWSSLLFSSIQRIPFRIEIIGRDETLQLVGDRLEAFKIIIWDIESIGFTGSSELSYRVDKGDWKIWSFDQKQIKDIGPIKPGLYDFRVRIQNELGEFSKYFYLNDSQVLGKSLPPGDVRNLTLTLTSDRTGRLNWNPTEDLDVRVGGTVEIRFLPSVLQLPRSSADGWAAAEPIARVAGNATSHAIQISSGSYLARFQDTAEPPNYSLASASVSTNDFGFLSKNVVLEISEPEWPGTLEGFEVVDGELVAEEVYGWGTVNQKWDEIDIPWNIYSPSSQLTRSLPDISYYCFKTLLQLPGDMDVNISFLISHYSKKFVYNEFEVFNPIEDRLTIKINNWESHKAFTPFFSPFTPEDSIVQPIGRELWILGNTWVSTSTVYLTDVTLSLSATHAIQFIRFEAKIIDAENAVLLGLSLSSNATTYSAADEYTLLKVAGSDSRGTLIAPDSVDEAGWGTYEYSFVGQGDLSVAFNRLTIACVSAPGTTAEVRFRNIEIVSSETKYQYRRQSSEFAGEAIARLEIKSQSGGVWEDWRPFFPGTYRLSAAQFRLASESFDVNQDFVKSATIVCDVPDRRYREVLETISGFTRVSFTPPYNRAPEAVAVIVQNAQAGDRAVYTDLAATGFLVAVVDSNSAFVVRTIEIQTESY